MQEVFQEDDVIAREIDPLEADRFTQTDGTLIISHPEPNIDRGKYHCTAENIYGRVKSRTATLGFGCEFFRPWNSFFFGQVLNRRLFTKIKYSIFITYHVLCQRPSWKLPLW